MSLPTIGVWKYENAITIANEFVKQIQPHCKIALVAGSLRRKEPFVNDIEIICLPKMVPQKTVVTEKVPVLDLFGDDSHTRKIQKVEDVLVRDPEFVRIAHSYECMKGDALIGRYTQRMMPGNIKLDLFMPQEHDFYRMLVIRTGSVNFVREYIAKSWAHRGWRGTDDGLRRVKECIHKNNKWICIADKPTLPPIWQSEEEFFTWVGYSYTNPENRSLG